MQLTYAYAADITKAERDENGDLIVYGKATGPDLDLDGDRCDPDWLKEAMPEWFEWGNVREMHSSVLAGIGVELTQDGDDWHVKSKCIDAGAAKKIEEGGYKGYSIGIKNGVRQTRDGQPWIVGGQIVEVSYVDRPCNPTAKIAIAKAAMDDELHRLKPVEADEHATAKKLVKAALDMDKLEDHDDVDGAMEAIAVIARLIMSEASDLADGQVHELYDIHRLLDAADSLKWFMAAEEGQMDMRNEITYGAEPDEIKGAFSINQYRKHLGLEPVAGGDEKIVLKRQFTAEQRRQMAAKGQAMPGGRYPIANSEDLGNAIKALGRGKGSHSAIKQHIISRAKALGLTSELPEGWMTKKKTPEVDDAKSAEGATETVQEIVKAAVAEVAKASEERITALEAELTKVKAQPVPGGPVLVAPSGQTAPTKDDKAAKAARLRAYAETLDPSVRGDYLALAARYEAETA